MGRETINPVGLRYSGRGLCHLRIKAQMVVKYHFIKVVMIEAVFLQLEHHPFSDVLGV